MSRLGNIGARVMHLCIMVTAMLFRTGLSQRITNQSRPDACQISALAGVNACCGIANRFW